MVSEKHTNMRTGAYQRTTSGFFIEAITYDKLLSFSRQRGDELIINSVLDIESRSSRAVLTSVVKDTQGSPVCSFKLAINYRSEFKLAVSCANLVLCSLTRR
jgi:hypothetical protein